LLQPVPVQHGVRQVLDGHRMVYEVKVTARALVGRWQHCAAYSLCIKTVVIVSHFEWPKHSFTWSCTAHTCSKKWCTDFTALYDNCTWL